MTTGREILNRIQTVEDRVRMREVLRPSLEAAFDAGVRFAEGGPSREGATDAILDSVVPPISLNDVSA